MSTLDLPAADRPSVAARSAWLIRTEIMKIRTTKVWWLFLIAMVAVTGLALVFNGISHHYELNPPLSNLDAGQVQAAVAAAQDARGHAGLVRIVSEMVTSGQLFGLMFAMILGILVVTNEFLHQTATITFTVSPHRGTVVLGKGVTAAMFGVLFWAVATVLNVIVTPLYLNSQHVWLRLTEWEVVRSMLLSLLAYVIWAILGLGLGTLIRSQVGAVVTGLVGYLIGAAAIALIFQLIYNLYPHDWVVSLEVIAPAIANAVMVTPGRAFEHAPPQWVGGAVLLGYTFLAGGLGTWITRRRDVG